MKPYEKLSKIYKKDWGQDSSKYTALVSTVIDTYKLNVHSILDIACGTGILAYDLYNKGFQVTGIDISEDMINVAKENAHEINFEIADMTSFNLHKKFDLITCALDAINYVTTAELMLNALKHIYLHLSDDGFFIFDINTPLLYEEHHFGTIDRTFDDLRFKQILEYNNETKLAKTIFDFGNNGMETHIQRAYSIDEMDNLLVESGFKIMNKYKNFKLNPIDEKTYKAFYVVKKNS